MSSSISTVAFSRAKARPSLVMPSHTSSASAKLPVLYAIADVVIGKLSDDGLLRIHVGGDLAAGLEFLPDVPERQRGIGGVVDDLVAVDEVEVFVRKWQAIDVGVDEVHVLEPAQARAAFSSACHAVSTPKTSASLPAWAAKLAASRPAPVPASRMRFLPSSSCVRPPTGSRPWRCRYQSV